MLSDDQSLTRGSVMNSTHCAANEALSDGRPLYRAGLSDGIRETLEPYFLLTNRRVLAVVNVGEDELDNISAEEHKVAEAFNDAGDNVEVIGMCVQLEAEAAAISDPIERAEMLDGLGLGEALFRMVRSAYHLLGLRTFFTTGDKESRMDVPRRFDCAGVRRTNSHRFPTGIHSG